MNFGLLCIGDELLDGRLLKNKGENLFKLCVFAEWNEADAWEMLPIRLDFHPV